MSGQPISPKEDDDEDYDFELDLDNLDDAALQRLLEEDPALEEELNAIEAAEVEAYTQAAEDHAVLPEGDPAVAEETAVPPPASAMGESAPAPVDEGAFDDDLLGADDEEADLAPSASTEMQAPEGGDVDDEELGADAPFVATPDHDDLADFEVEAAALPPQADDAEAFPDGEEEVTELEFRPVPRINIHAFCSSERITDLVERAGADRRLAKAHLTLQQGDAATAAEMFQYESSPNLLIIEAGESAQALLDGLDRLAQVCDPSTQVIVVGDINDIRLYRELMNRGISEYVVRPKGPLQLISSIGSLYADPSAPPIGKTYVFVGARGGVGSSTICHNVAWSLAEDFRLDTILIDLDLAFGTVGLDFEFDPSQGLADALQAPERLDPVLLDRLLQKCTDRLSLFSAPNLLDRDYDLPTSSFEALIDIVRNAAPIIALDLPHIWSGWSKMMLQTADEIVLTVTPDLSSFRNAKNILETIKAHRSNDADPHLVINQNGVPKRPEVPFEQFEDALELKPEVVVPWDPLSFGTAATNAETLYQAAPKAKATQEIRRIGGLLTGREGVNKPSGFSLKSLFGKQG